MLFPSVAKLFRLAKKEKLTKLDFLLCRILADVELIPQLCDLIPTLLEFTLYKKLSGQNGMCEIEKEVNFHELGKKRMMDFEVSGAVHVQ